MIGWMIAQFVLALAAAVMLVLGFAEWVFTRTDGRTIICWNCLEEYKASATNCPAGGVVKTKPYRCGCGLLHPAGQKPCDFKGGRG